MPQSDELPVTKGGGSTVREYILSVRIVKSSSPDEDGPHYRFEAPQHEGTIFEDRDCAELYADVYFDVNGFEEAGTGDRGVPPEIVQAGRDTLVAYFLTQRGTDVNWVASFYGEKPEKVRRYVSRVRKRAGEIREGARERGME
jgi:hypothetical protein